MAQNAQLTSLIGRFDDWFRDLALEEPIDQFLLDTTNSQHGGEEEKEEANGSECKASKKDKIRLGIISRTTTNWFKSLTLPLITDDGIDMSEEDLEALAAAQEEEEDSQLDAFADELDKLLDGHENDPYASNSRSTLHAVDNDSDNDSDNENHNDRRQVAMQDIYYFSSHASDELALADPEIGQCCTVSTSASTSGRQTQAITVLQSSLRSSYDSFGGELRTQSLTPSTDPIVQTPMPPDHDYLSKPAAEPVELRTPLACNRISRDNSEPILYLMAMRKRQKLESVLNTGALKRFARYSDRLRLLSCE